MAKFEPTKISCIKEIWEEEGFYFKKNFSQNFLIDKNIVNKIVQSANIQCGDTVLEIGPGSGALTLAMLELGAVVYAVEIDTTASKILQKYLKDYPKFHLIEGDFLKQNLDFLPENTKIVSNLPYHITSPIIGRIAEISSKIELVIIMVQKEMADRITAKAPSRNRSSFSIFTDFYFKKKSLFSVKPPCFTPRPKVDSIILSLIPKKELPKVNKESFFGFIKKCFSQKRKKITTIIKDPNVLQSLTTLSLNPNARAEEISTNDFIKLHELLSSFGNQEK